MPFISVNLFLLSPSLSLSPSFAAKTTFSVEPREFSMLTTRCLATLPAKEIREQKVQVGSAVVWVKGRAGVEDGEGGCCQQCWQSVNPALRFSSMLSCVGWPFTSPPSPVNLFPSPLVSLLSYFLPLRAANEQCWRLRCKRVDRQLRTLCKYLTWSWVKRRDRGKAEEKGMAWQVKGTVNCSFFGQTKVKVTAPPCELRFSKAEPPFNSPSPAPFATPLLLVCN